MRYARLSFFVFESSIFLFRKVKLWYTKVQSASCEISVADFPWRTEETLQALVS